MCPSIRPSAKCKTSCMGIYVADFMLLYRFVCFLFVRRSVRSSVHPPSCRRSVSLNAIFKSDAYMDVRDIPYFSLRTSNFLLLTSYCSNFDVYSRVCMRAYEGVWPMRACV